VETAHRVAGSLKAVRRDDAGGVRVKVDDRAGIKPGAKYFEWEMRGVPLRMELGPRDLASGQGVLVRRDTKTKEPVALDAVTASIDPLLTRMQSDMLAAARARREEHSVRGAVTYERFREIMEGEGAFVYAGWCGESDCEAAIKEETRATIRVLPDEEFRSPEAPTTCLRCQSPATSEAVWAKAY
jgi:prolyl-tRNA synthetase